ncbi:MAG: TIGR03087 family PEP-CTERM/XrtA system glycosyltransferase [Novosphingobium sp.]
MREILFISHRIPFPPDRGDKIRSHNILKRLVRIAPVHVATFADDDADTGEEVELASLAASYRLVRRTKPLALAGLQALAKGAPISLKAFYDVHLAEYVEEVLAKRQISTIYVFSGQMGQYVPDGFEGRVVVDFVDADSAKFAAYARNEWGPARWVHAREAKLLRAEEARLAMRADVSLLVSPAETEEFISQLPAGVADRVDVRSLANGIDSDFFHPRAVDAEPRMLEFPHPRLIFTGQMDYKPNIAAALRVADRILPLIRQHMPEATFHVVGRNPSASLLARDGIGGVHVWGRVEDIRCWLKGANLAIVPLEIARGVQNKVLEAMAMALPIVLSPGAATGIGAQHGKHFAVADSDEDLARAAMELLSSLKLAQARGLAARRFASEKATWQAALDDLPEIVGWPAPLARDAA